MRRSSVPTVAVKENKMEKEIEELDMWKKEMKRQKKLQQEEDQAAAAMAADDSNQAKKKHSKFAQRSKSRVDIPTKIQINESKNRIENTKSLESNKFPFFELFVCAVV
jgi:hypothetical protein